MIQEEIKTRVDLAYEQIDRANQRIKELQAKCNHSKAKLAGTVNIYKICCYCNKMLEIDGSTVNDWW